MILLGMELIGLLWNFFILFCSLKAEVEEIDIEFFKSWG